MTDPVSDMIVRIKAALLRKQELVDMPGSKFKAAIASVLKEEGFLSNFEELTKGKKKFLRLRFKWGRDEYGKLKYSSIRNIKRVSSPGCRVYKPADKLHRLYSGFGTYVISTSKGLKTDNQARAEKLGGEVLLMVS
ncbi:MAG: 30S ribosomal protein S8 [Candidatus Saganbacteria bacterium]|nr:30S ribosomal protein S8 [Candidatus Saganbacteria bacterium]